MGGSLSQLTHQYVLEALTGLPEAETEAKRLIRFGFGMSLTAAFVIIVLAAATNNSVGDAALIGLGLLLASTPFAVWALTYATRISLAKNNLRLKQILIGRRNYNITEDRAFIVREDGVAVKSDFYTELQPFSIACSLISDEPSLTPARGASAWQALRTFNELPGVAVGFSSFGAGGHAYAFVYGLPKTILADAKEIWDLGHVRKISEADITLFKNTASTWKKQDSTVVAVAYAPLPTGADPLTLDAQEIAQELTLLGLVSVHGTREYGRSFPIDPAQGLHTAARSNLSTSMAALFLGVISYFGFILFSLPLAIGMVQILILKLAIEILPISSLAWDHAGQNKGPGKKTRAVLSRVITDTTWAGLFMGGLAMTNFILYFGRHNFEISTVVNQSVAHTGAMAIALLTVALCVLASIVMQRDNGRLLNRYQLYNPLFILGLASALLLTFVGAYVTGPLVAGDIWFAVGAMLLFIVVRLLQTYANNHHTRDHILELLKTV